jgi:hypothetical protein
VSITYRVRRTVRTLRRSVQRTIRRQYATAHYQAGRAMCAITDRITNA